MDSAFMNSKASSFLNFVTIRHNVIQPTFPTSKVDLFLFLDQWPWRPVCILRTATNVSFLVFSFLVNTRSQLINFFLFSGLLGFGALYFEKPLDRGLAGVLQRQ